MDSGFGADAPPRNDDKAAAHAAAFLLCGIALHGARIGL